MATRGHYAGMNTSGFKDFYLKDAIMKAISYCGFEHPSEGRFCASEEGANACSAACLHSSCYYEQGRSVPGKVGYG